MAKDTALFEDDFDFDDFENSFEQASPQRSANDALQADPFSELETELPVNLDPPRKEVEPIESIEDLSDVTASSVAGDRPIPAIAIQAFIESAATREMLETISRDRRLARASFEIHDGGLAAATAHLAANVSPNLLLVESSAPAKQMIVEIDSLAGHCDPGVEVMVIGATNDIPLYRQLVARGVSEYLVPPLKPLDVIRSISNLFTDPDAPFMGRSIAVVGAKGGVGASTIAHNLAWAMAENARMNTTLVDLDISFGTTALDFNEDPQQTVIDALLDPERADEAVVARLLTKATDRLSLFAAPATVGDLPEIDPENYGKVIETVRRNTPFVVLDLPHIWSSWVMQALTDADEVVLVCQPDLASLRNGKNILDQIKAARPNDKEPRLVLNMAGVPKRPEIPVKDFAHAIGVEPCVILPFEPHLFGMASNNGQMISETDPLAKASMAIDHLATLITGQVVEQKSKSFLSKLMGK